MFNLYFTKEILILGNFICLQKYFFMKEMRTYTFFELKKITVKKSDNLI